MTARHLQSPALHRKPDSLARHSTGRQILLDRFRAMLEQHEPNRTTASSNTDRTGELEAEIGTLRARESDEMRAANRNMAQHIQALSLLVYEQERQIAKLQLELSGSTRVVPPVGLVRR